MRTEPDLGGVVRRNSAVPVRPSAVVLPTTSLYEFAAARPVSVVWWDVDIVVAGVHSEGTSRP
jgi:hypothetical protein